MPIKYELWNYTQIRGNNCYNFVFDTGGTYMLRERSISIFLFASALFYIAGCKSGKTPEREGGYYYSGIYFGKNLSPNYKQGITDGCITAKGEYKKSHTLFNSNQGYNDGWFLGRNRCKHLLIVDVDEKIWES